MAQRKQAPSLFIQKKKPSIKVTQTSVNYSSNGPAPLALDAEKIAKMDAELERRGINTLKGPKKVNPEKESQRPGAKANAQKPVVSQPEVQQPLAATQNAEKTAIPDVRIRDPVIMEKTGDTIMENTIEKLVVAAKKHEPSVATVEEVQKPITEQKQDVTPKVTVVETQKHEAPKPGIRKKFISLLRARKSAIIQLKKALSEMKLPEAVSSSTPPAEQPKATLPATALPLSPLAAMTRTPPEALIPLPLSPVATVPKTPPEATTPLPISPDTAGPRTPLAASIPLPLSPITTVPKTPPQATTPLPLSPIDVGANTPPEAFIPLPLSPIPDLLSTPPEAAIPLPASPVIARPETPSQASDSWPSPMSSTFVTPQTPLQHVMVFPFTPDTTNDETASPATFPHLKASLATVPQPINHAGIVLPPTPATGPPQMLRADSTIPSQIYLSDGSRETFEPLPFYLPAPETQAPVAATPYADFCPQTPETETSWIDPEAALAWARALKSPTPEPHDVDEPMISYSDCCTQTSQTATLNTYIQVASILPQTPTTPKSEPAELCEPMILSSSIYDMSPAHSIHETSDLMEFVMSCVPRTSDPLPAWELYFNKNLANTISAFSANCRFEHPGANRQNANPFSALAGGGNNNRGGFGRPAGSEGYPFSLNKDTIYKDLTEERPSWVLSAYGPGRDAPEQLWGGYPIEQSFEEARLHFVMGQAAGNPQGAVSFTDFKESSDNELTVQPAQRYPSTRESSAAEDPDGSAEP